MKNQIVVPLSIVLASIIISFGVYNSRVSQFQKTNIKEKTEIGGSHLEPSVLELAVLPSDGVILPVLWGDLGKQLVAKGVIDDKKFRALYAERGGLNKEREQFLSGINNDKLKILALK